MVGILWHEGGGGVLVTLEIGRLYVSVEVLHSERYSGDRTRLGVSVSGRDRHMWWRWYQRKGLGEYRVVRGQWRIGQFSKIAGRK